MAYKRAGVEAARRPDRALHVAALFGALLLYASAALCQESPSPSPSSSPSPVGDLRADVDLNDVSAESALRFLADEEGEKGARKRGRIQLEQIQKEGFNAAYAQRP